jgi:hypothetical protein
MSHRPCIPPFRPSHGHEDHVKHSATADCAFYTVGVGYTLGIYTDEQVFCLLQVLTRTHLQSVFFSFLKVHSEAAGYWIFEWQVEEVRHILQGRRHLEFDVHPISPARRRLTCIFGDGIPTTLSYLALVPCWCFPALILAANTCCKDAVSHLCGCTHGSIHLEIGAQRGTPHCGRSRPSIAGHLSVAIAVPLEVGAHRSSRRALNVDCSGHASDGVDEESRRMEGWG